MSALDKSTVEWGSPSALRRESMSGPATGKYPLLGEILTVRGLPLKAMYCNRDIAAIFGVSIRTIQNRIADGQLVPGDLPGRAKFLSSDLKEFLSDSRKRG